MHSCLLELCLCLCFAPVFFYDCATPLLSLSCGTGGICDKHRGQKQLREERVNFRLQPVMKGSQVGASRKNRQKPKERCSCLTRELPPCTHLVLPAWGWHCPQRLPSSPLAGNCPADQGDGCGASPAVPLLCGRLKAEVSSDRTLSCPVPYHCNPDTLHS